MSTPRLTPTEIFGDTAIGWGKKYPRETTLLEIWNKDRSYLHWAAGLDEKKKSEFLLPPFQRKLVEISARIEREKLDVLEAELRELYRWRELRDEGIGLEALDRPSAAKCRKILADCTVLAGHGDLDGVLSMAAAISEGGALGGIDKGSVPFSRLRILRYGYRDLGDFTTRLDFTSNDVLVIIDFSAHPDAALTLDHHTTCLSFWEYGTPVPNGIFDPSMPSCPRLLAEHCDLKIPKRVLQGSDMIDGAIYKKIEEASDLDDPFVALAYALDLDVGETMLKKIVVTLAKEALRPEAVLSEPGFAARVELLRHELEEQRRFWGKGKWIEAASEYVAVADARLAPYPASRFRHLPFEHSVAAERPYLITIRGSAQAPQVNIGFGRNPFFANRAFFENNPFNAGACARRLGSGGGRMEVASLNVPTPSLGKSVERIASTIGESVQKP